jgi:hypothetical protein
VNSPPLRSLPHKAQNNSKLSTNPVKVAIEHDILSDGWLLLSYLRIKKRYD